MKICPNCALHNPDDACFCYNCGNSLKSPMEIYPELNFQPTSVYNWQKPLFSRSLYLPVMLIMILAISWALYCILFDDYEGEELWIILCLWIFSFLLCLYRFISNKRKISKLNDVSLQNIADYIQMYTLWDFSKKSQYVFFVKNNKMGVLDVQSQRVVIPAEYDMLTWETKNNWKTKYKILQAKIHGSTFLIDINNKKLS